MTWYLVKHRDNFTFLLILHIVKLFLDSSTIPIIINLSKGLC